MMHQKCEPLIKFNDRPIRESIIQKDEVVSLIIDINLLSVDEFIQKYCYSYSQESSLEREIQ